MASLKPARNLRKRDRVDYALLNNGKMPRKQQDDSSSEEDSLDISGERELVEDDEEYLDIDPEEEDNFPEEGELVESDEGEDEEDEFAELIKKYTKEGNVKKLKQILIIKKEKCEALSREIMVEQKKEKDKQLKEILGELSKVNKRKNDLERSLANSRNNSPEVSPRRQKVKSTKKTSTKVKASTSKGRRAVKTPSSTKRTQRTDEKREYEEILNSFINLKQGSAEAYSELVEEAMNATDNILKLKNTRKRNETKCRKPLDFESAEKITAPVKQQVNNCSQNELPKHKALELLNALQSITGNKRRLSGKAIETIIGEVEQLDGIHTYSEGNTNKVTMEQHDEETKTKNASNKGKRGEKLVSGKCSKPDETDIQLVVKFPHERLDPRHTSINDRQFDRLPFHLLVAGELETTASTNIGPEERTARINIAKTICYHKAYLGDEELRNGYDQLLKSVEQGNSDWTDDLGEKLHKFYDYQANKAIREKVKLDNSRNSEKLGRPPINNKSEVTTEVEKIIYCSAFNKGRCTYNDHHEGKFDNKTVTKWHICSKCCRKGEKKSHREDQCTNRA